MQFLRKATAATIMFGPFVDKTDAVTLKTDATTITDIDHASTGIFLSKAGAAAAIRHASVTASVADAYGMMKVTLDTTDTGTTGTLDVLFAKAATYLPVNKRFTVLEQVVYDVLFGTVALATVSNITGGVITTATNLTNNHAKYMHGAVWLGTDANTNTTSYVDGIMTNPVSTIAAAKSIADNLKIKRFWVQSGVTVTLGAAYVGYVFTGAGYIMALGGQDISKTIIESVEGLSGTATCPTGEAIIRNSHLGPTAITIGEVDFNDCHLMGTVTMSQATVPYLFNKCTGVSAAKITFAAASQSAVISKWSGPLTIAGMVSTNTLFLDGDGDVTFDNTNNTGTVYISGNIRLTNNGTSMNITDTSRWGEDQTIAVATSVTNNVNADVKKINAVTITGTGAVGNEFGV